MGPEEPEEEEPPPEAEGEGVGGVGAGLGAGWGAAVRMIDGGAGGAFGPSGAGVEWAEPAGARAIREPPEGLGAGSLAAVPRPGIGGMLSSLGSGTLGTLTWIGPTGRFGIDFGSAGSRATAGGAGGSSGVDDSGFGSGSA